MLSLEFRDTVVQGNITSNLQSYVQTLTILFTKSKPRGKSNFQENHCTDYGVEAQMTRSANVSQDAGAILRTSSLWAKGKDGKGSCHQAEV